MAFHRRKVRLNWVDYAVFATLIATIVYVWYRVDSVLEYNWEWSIIPHYLYRWDEEEQRWVANLLMQGLYTTIRLALWGIVLAAIIGVVFGIMRTSRRLFPRMLSRVYVELIRNIPPLVFIFIFYFFISSQIMPLLGIEEFIRHASPETLAWLEVLFGPPKLISNVISGVICLAMFEGAYVTEIVRAGIQSIPKTQTEAGLSIGLSRLQLMRYVILPQGGAAGGASTRRAVHHPGEGFVHRVADLDPGADLPRGRDRGVDDPHVRGLDHGGRSLLLRVLFLRAAVRLAREAHGGRAAMNAGAP